MSAQDVRVRFSPEMKTRFARLEAMLTDSKHFPIEMANTLRDLASGREMTILDVMLHLAMIVKDAVNHTHATVTKERRMP